ncbi:MAG: flagellar biosynthesis protein FlhA [Phycisphaerales bacterium]
MARFGLDKPNPTWVRVIEKHRAVVVPVGFVLLLCVILVPLPTVLMDVLIAVNICIGVVLLMTTMYSEEPLELSVFPSLLLATTLFRLVLNVASTRLILTADASSPQEAQEVAGKVISAFGSFVAGGSLIVGAIIFLILVLVQFLVITKGATRIGEVAARFTLDAMPGKQMAIDADLNAGIINEEQARQRREQVAAEADFFGAMDGAGKFVRGDAIAGIIITLINIVGGFAIGALEKGWALGDTARVFTILTIGDGIASQIPSFIIAIAAALIVTRTGSKANLGQEITSQLAARPAAMFITAAFIAALALTPLPAIPLLTLSGIVFATGFFITRDRRSAEAAEAKRAEVEAQREASELPEEPIEALLKVDTLELEVGFGLVALVDSGQGGDLLDRISGIRRQLAEELGFVMPPVRIRDNMTMGANDYRIKVRGNAVASGQTRPSLLMAMDSGITTGKINGEPTTEPAFGLSAYWIDPNLRSRAESLNYTVVDPASVLTTHLLETVKRYAEELLTREEVANLIEQLKQRAPKLIEQAIPEVVPVGLLQKVLQGLLRERVPIRDLETIIETLAEWKPRTSDPDVLIEYVRNGLRRSICRQYASEGMGGSGPGERPRLVCVTLDPDFEDYINGYIDRSPAGTTVTMPASGARLVAERLASTLRPVLNGGHPPVVIASPQVRAPVRQLAAPHIPGIVVLGYNEIVPEIEVESLGLVSMPKESGSRVSAA